MKNYRGDPGIYYRKKRRRKKIAVLLLCACLFCISAALYFQHNVTKVLISISEATMRAHTTVAINDAVYYTLSDGVRYEDLVTVERGETGNVTSISADSLKINKIARDAASISQSNLKNLSLNGIPVPLGALTGIEALAGLGPKIHIRIIPVSSVTCEFSSEFESVGINQTKHSLYLNVIADISIVMPSRANACITESTSPTISGSSAEVGSSNSSTSGSMASARAMATRCFCPPEICRGFALM